MILDEETARVGWKRNATYSRCKNSHIQRQQQQQIEHVIFKHVWKIA